MANFNFMHLGLDIFAGSILGSTIYVLEKTIVTISPLFKVAVKNGGPIGQHLALTAGLLVFAGSIFFKVGSKAYEKSEQEMSNK